jgi:hypothetical protein
MFSRIVVSFRRAALLVPCGAGSGSAERGGVHSRGQAGSQTAGRKRPREGSPSAIPSHKAYITLVS